VKSKGEIQKRTNIYPLLSTVQFCTVAWTYYETMCRKATCWI